MLTSPFLSAAGLMSSAAARAACSAMSAARDLATITWPPSTIKMSSASVTNAKITTQSDTEPRSPVLWRALVQALCA